MITMASVTRDGRRRDHILILEGEEGKKIFDRIRQTPPTDFTKIREESAEFDKAFAREYGLS